MSKHGAELRREANYRGMHVPNCEQSHDAISQHYAVFQDLVTHAQSYFHRHRNDIAAVYAEIAANYAMCHHTGLFMSAELEETLRAIGRKIIPKTTYAPEKHMSKEGSEHVLHVLTHAAGIGGDARLVWRWIQSDGGRRHSVVLTRQGSLKVPPQLTNAVHAANGRIYVLNNQVGDILTWASKLRDIASLVDVVVLHVHPYDVIPVLAFADKDKCPLVMYVNLADHVFWVGASISDLVVNLRNSGLRLSHMRRGIESERGALLPTPLHDVKRTLTRSEAKQRLGLSDETVVLLSIARPHKYTAVEEPIAFINQLTFPDALVPILQRHENAVLLVVGPEESASWRNASDKTQGRIKAMGPREDTIDFYQAADIYVDSFPIVSITSLLEAASYGLPLVSCNPFSEDAAVLGADTPSLAQHLIRVRDIDEYRLAVSRLIEDRDLRLQVGANTQEAVLTTHSGPGWSAHLQGLYRQAMTVSPVQTLNGSKAYHTLNELDILIPHIFRGETELEDIVQFHLRLFPLDLRMRLWLKHALKHRAYRPGLLLPEWLGIRLERWRHRDGRELYPRSRRSSQKPRTIDNGSGI